MSHQIALLEEDVGARLFNRANRRVSLTVAGEVMLEEARRILGAVDRARERMQEVVRGAVGRIRLGASPTAGLHLLAPLLASYRETHPTYDLHLELGPAHRIAERVAANELDMGFIASRPAATELRSRVLVSDSMVVIAGARHRFAGVHGLKLARLESECWIVREESSETRRALAAWWHRHHVQPSRTMAFEGPDAVKRATMAGLGIALTSRLTVYDELARGAVATLDVRPAPPMREFVLIDHPQKHHGAACRAMLALVERQFRRPDKPDPH